MSNAQSPGAPTRYFAMHYNLFRFLGLGWWHHPDENDTRNFPGWYLYYAIITEVVLVAGFIGLESIDPFIGEKDLDRFMFGVSFVITHDLTLIKIFIIIVKNNDIQDIARTLEIRLKQFYQNNDRNRKMVRMTRIFTGTFLVFGWLTIINTNAYGIIQDIRWKSKIAQVNDTATKPLRTLPQPMYIPWNYQSDITYIATIILETFGLMWTGHILISIDTFIAAIILHLSSQFTTLQEALTTAYDRTFADLTENINRDIDGGHTIDDPPNSDLVSYQERLARAYRTEKDIENALENTIRNCIRQHQILIGCVEKLESIYSYGFMTQLLSSMAVICVVMVQVSKDSSSLISISLATSLAFFAAMVVQLAIQCFTGSELTHQASLVSDAVMQCKWERMPPRIRRMLLLTMRRSQKPLQLTAAGFVYLDNDCFVAIMKGAYSYYAVLSQKQI